MGGASIVPKEEDRARLVEIAAARELEKDEMRVAAREAKTKYFEKRDAEDEPTLLTNQLGEDAELEWHQPTVQDPNPVKNKKLTRAQRNKRERHKASLKAALETRGQKSKEAELTHVGTYMKQIISTEKEQAVAAESRRRSAEEKLKYHPRKLSRNAFEEARPAVLLAEEVAGSLRETHKEGSLL